MKGFALCPRLISVRPTSMQTQCSRIRSQNQIEIFIFNGIIVRLKSNIRISAGIIFARAENYFQEILSHINIREGLILYHKASLAKNEIQYKKVL